MSNKIVPQVYRTIIDDVVANVQIDFQDYGMDEDILVNLQAKWEAKLLETRVAEFARAPGSRSPSPSAGSPGEPSKPRVSAPPTGALPGTSSQGQAYDPSPSLGLALPGAASSSQQGGVNVKAEPVDDVLRIRGGAADHADNDFKPLIKAEPNAAGLLPGDEVIDSDLDDSDDELRDEGEDGEAEGEVDIVFCVYDKVQRVKNKWKTVLKDGMIHINGKDYLFGKCNGEFEW